MGAKVAQKREKKKFFEHSTHEGSLHQVCQLTTERKVPWIGSNVHSYPKAPYVNQAKIS